jgi:single-stranded-DNA-specific exonuclease
MLWIDQPKINKKARKALSKYDDITAQLLFNRGLTQVDEIEQFFNPAIADLPSFQIFQNIDKAVTRILEAIDKKEKLVIYGDYDVDGVCSSAILFDFLFRKIGANVIPYIPSRFDEGYGLNLQSLKKIKDDGANLLITVDCGIRDGKLLNKFSKNGLDIIVTDHHQLPETKEVEILLKSTMAVIHPEFSELENKSICATTVVWYLVKALESSLGNKFPKVQLAESEYLDLVALGTVCDIMPLVNENRIFLKLGIEKMQSTSIIGLKELIDIAGINSDEIEPYHLGFILGPKLNAAGRLESAMDALRLLTTQSKSKARDLAVSLTELNAERQELTKKLLTDAELKIQQLGKDKKLYFIVGDNWPEGIVGLVAGKLTEKYNKPVLVGSTSDGKTTGSARSIKGFHVTDAISKSSSILSRFGGHSQAAGFTVETVNLEEFILNIQNEAQNSITDEMLEKKLVIDSQIDINDLNIEIVKKIEKFAPFGYMNKKPVIRLNAVKLKDKKIIGSKRDHLKFIVGDGYNFVEVIGFGKAHLFDEYQVGEQIDIAGNLDINNFMNQQTLQMILIDIRKSHESS